MIFPFYATGIFNTQSTVCPAKMETVLFERSPRNLENIFHAHRRDTYSKTNE